MHACADVDDFHLCRSLEYQSLRSLARKEGEGLGRGNGGELHSYNHVITLYNSVESEEAIACDMTMAQFLPKQK
jgi:hypothetical protein